MEVQIIITLLWKRFWHINSRDFFRSIWLNDTKPENLQQVQVQEMIAIRSTNRWYLDNVMIFLPLKQFVSTDILYTSYRKLGNRKYQWKFVFTQTNNANFKIKIMLQLENCVQQFSGKFYLCFSQPFFFSKKWMKLNFDLL